MLVCFGASDRFALLLCSALLCAGCRRLSVAVLRSERLASSESRASPPEPATPQQTLKLASSLASKPAAHGRCLRTSARLAPARPRGSSAAVLKLHLACPMPSCLSSPSALLCSALLCSALQRIFCRSPRWGNEMNQPQDLSSWLASSALSKPSPGEPRRLERQAGVEGFLSLLQGDRRCSAFKPRGCLDSSLHARRFTMLNKLNKPLTMLMVSYMMYLSA